LLVVELGSHMGVPQPRAFVGATIHRYILARLCKQVEKKFKDREALLGNPFRTAPVSRRY
jgi:hypothetical protein